MLKKLISFVTVACMMLTGIFAFSGCKGENKMNNLLKDTEFQNGFMLFNKGISIGNLATFGKGPRSWFMYQNNSRFIMKNDSLKVDTANEKLYENDGKKVRVYKDENGDYVLNFALYCNNEYETPRTQVSDPWVHLMFEQRFENGIGAANFSELNLSIDVQHNNLVNHMTPEEHNPNIMCAQTNIYFILRNNNPQSEDYQSFIWLGLTMFDDRKEIPTGSYMVDSGFEGATDTLIYCPNMREYIDSSVHDKEWHTVKCELISLIGEALEKSKAKNYFTSTEIEDLVLENFYISTEVSGTFTHEMSFKNIVISGVEK